MADCESDQTSSVTTVPMIEARGDDGRKFRIRVIEAGLSGNRNYWPEQTLREALPVFNGVRVMVKSDAAHLNQDRQAKDVRNIIGGLSDAAFIEAQDNQPGAVYATLTALNPDRDEVVMMREAASNGMANLFGFSVDAVVEAQRVVVGGKPVRAAHKIRNIKSVDMIVEAGAGGELINMIEAQKEPVMERQELITMLEAKGLVTTEGAEKMTDDQLVIIMTEALSHKAEAAPPDTTSMAEVITMVEARSDARDQIDATTLPDAAKQRLKDEIKTAETVDTVMVEALIKQEQDYLTSVSGGGAVTGLGGSSHTIQFGETQGDKIVTMLEAFFDEAHADHKSARSFKQC